MVVFNVISTEEFNTFVLNESKIHNNKYIIADFYAPWCKPCKEYAPTYDELSEKYKDKITFLKVNIEENEELADVYDIQKFPTFIIFNEGSLETNHERIIGVKSAIPNMENILDRLGTLEIDDDF